MRSAECGVDGVASMRGVAARPRIDIPHSTLRTPHFVSPVSICHTRAERLDCPVKYGAPVPPADLPHSRGAHGRAHRAGGGRVGAGGSHGRPVGRNARRVGRSCGPGPLAGCTVIPEHTRNATDRGREATTIVIIV